MIPASVALSPGYSGSRCTCSTTDGIGAVGGIGGVEEEAMMAERAEEGPYPWCGAGRGPRQERSAKRKGSKPDESSFTLCETTDQRAGKRYVTETDGPTSMLYEVGGGCGEGVTIKY